jgi:succinate dehydrogenase/fumarate reductase flavoprotein subunit
MADVQVDLLVIGAGIAGMSAAAYAARAGASVAIVEKGSDVGGSAVLSGGGLWTASSVDGFLELDPGANRELIELLVSQYAEAGDWVESLGVQIGERIALDAIQGYPSVARVFDNLGYIQRCKSLVESAAGSIVVEATVAKLTRTNGRVTGAVVCDRDGETTVDAKWTVLATGGFQGDPGLRQRFIGAHASELLVRSNPNSTGDGLRLALEAGAQVRDTESFYGHLVASPLPGGFPPPAFLRLAQLYSPRGILLESSGQRVCDESIAYYNNAVAVSRLPGRRALLVADQAIRDYDRTAYGPSDQIDRPNEAARAGGRVAEADTLAGLDPIVAEWGYRGVSDGIETFNRLVTDDPEALRPSRLRHRVALIEPPFFALEVQPAITFTFGGICVDAQTRVLDENGRPIGGLLAAGADVAIYDSAYAGGLALGLVTGLQAAKTSVGELQIISG